jgi:hypothetical protein
MLLGVGIPQDVESWELHLTGPKHVGKQLLNPGKQSAWLPGHDCVWRQNGVWGLDSSGIPKLLRPDYFIQVNGRPVDFNHDYLRPFVNRYAAAIREIVPDALIFVETEPNTAMPRWGEGDAQRIISAPHWYDVLVLYLKNYHPWIGVDNRVAKTVLTPWAVRKSFIEQINCFHQEAIEHMGGVPTLLGEFGIHFDLRQKRAYRTGDFRLQVQALDRSMRLMEDTLTSCTIWNYTADNDNEHGDQWNDEDLSIFSRDQQKDPADINSGGRALEALVRPYARKIAGQPLRMSFDVRRRRFVFEFRHDDAASAPTEFYIPAYQYPHGYKVTVSDGSYEILASEQTLLYRHAASRQVHTVTVIPA